MRFVKKLNRKRGAASYDCFNHFETAPSAQLAAVAILVLVVVLVILAVVLIAVLILVVHFKNLRFFSLGVNPMIVCPEF